ncbi:hypothetical protein ES703_05606 [subsurface metagenome]
MVGRYALRCYALLYTKYGTKEFDQGSLAWFLSEPMRKKIFHVLTKGGWLWRIGRGRYACIRPDEVFRRQFEFKTPEMLKSAERSWCYAGASAVEIWTDFSYVQRSWEYSPYFIKVLKRDIGYWRRFFRGESISVFVREAGSAIGEFVVLEPVEKLDHIMHEGSPVDNLEGVVRFCERNLSAFEYPLAYLAQKYGLDVEVDQRIEEKVAEAL